MTGETPSLPLWNGSAFIADDYARTETPDAAPANMGLILSLEAFLALDETGRSSGRYAPEVLPGDAIDSLLPYLAGLPLIVLAFPVYNDGRSYSKAELLRSRHGYKGRLRASGDVLVDQIPHMVRVGFSELEVTHRLARQRLEDGTLTGFALHYQPAAKPAQTAGGYSWRRTA